MNFQHSSARLPMGCMHARCRMPRVLLPVLYQDVAPAPLQSCDSLSVRVRVCCVWGGVRMCICNCLHVSVCASMRVPLIVSWVSLL